MNFDVFEEMIANATMADGTMLEVVFDLASDIWTFNTTDGIVLTYDTPYLAHVEAEEFAERLEKDIDDARASKIAEEILPKIAHDLKDVPEHMRDKVWYYNNQRSLLDEDGYEMRTIRGEGHAL